MTAGTPAPVRDPLALLAGIKERTEAATPGPWWSDDGEDCWRLHGVAARIPAHGPVPEQVVNKQILKAPKQGTPYAEYWPGEADALFIIAARTDIPRLLAGYDALLKAHAPIQVYKSADACGHECPPEPDWNRSPAGDVIAAWDAYQDQHPYGTNPGGEADIRICELTPDRLACPACSKLVYETWGDDDGFVDASECVALPLIAAALSGEETPAS